MKTSWTSRPGLLYLMQRSGDGVLKIGWTSRDPQERRKQIAAEQYPHAIEILAYYPGSYADEAALHKRFARLRFAPDNPRSEWFWDSPEIHAHFAKHSAAYTEELAVQMSEALSQLEAS